MSIKFEIEDVVTIPGDRVEVRARLQDGRLACVSAPHGDDASYNAAVEAYLAEHFPEE